MTAYRSLKRRVPDTPIRAMSLSGVKMERSVFLSHQPNFLSCAEDYDILELLDQHIDRELHATAAFMASGFECP